MRWTLVRAGADRPDLAGVASVRMHALAPAGAVPACGNDLPGVRAVLGRPLPRAALAPQCAGGRLMTAEAGVVSPRTMARLESQRTPSCNRATLYGSRSP